MGETAVVGDFEKLDVRVGRVIAAQPFPAGRRSTPVLTIDFGPALGVRKSPARLAPNLDDELDRRTRDRLVGDAEDFARRQAAAAR